MKTSLKKILGAAVLVTAVFFAILNFRATSGKPEVKAKSFLTVVDAKAKAFQSSEPQYVNNLKGIYSVKHTSGANNLFLLVDAEAGLMEDVPLYCSFSSDAMPYLKDIEPGAELVISGVLARKENTVAVTDCKLTCINKGTISKDEYSFLP
jgi:hypothetical protein